MKKFTVLTLAALLALSLAACGSKEPASYPVNVTGPEQTSAPAPVSKPDSQAAEPGWLVAPRTDLEITESLADRAPATVVPGEWFRQMAFFEKDGGTGMIDLEGNIIIAPEEDVHWCPLCGVTTEGEDKIFNEKGEVVGSGGHGLPSGVAFYDPERDQLFSVSFGSIYPFDPRTLYSPEPFIADVVSIKTDPNATDYELETGDGAFEMATVSEPVGYMLFSPEGKPLDGVTYEAIQPRHEDLFGAKMAGKWGFVSAVDGAQAVPFIYDEVLPFHQGLAAVDSGEGWTYVSVAGLEKTGRVFEKATTAQDGRAWVRTEDGWGVADLKEWAEE